MDGDVAILWNAERTAADWQLLAEADLLLAPPIQTAVVVSLFTDARARADDRLPPGDTDPRGWWAGEVDDQQIGSRLWLLRRAKSLPETLRQARDMMREALAWMIKEDLAAAIDVAAEWDGPSRILARIVVHRGNGTTEAVTASWVWQGG